MKKIFYYLTIIPALLILTECKTKTSEVTMTSNPNLLKRVWMLTEFKDFEKSDLINKKAQINLTNLENAHAEMGCNKIIFKVEQKGENKINFSNLIMTKMMCENMSLEDSFAKTFSKLDTYKIEGHKLTLQNANGETMSFIAQDWD